MTAKEIIDLRQKRAKIIADIRTILDEHTDTVLSAETEKQINALEKDHDDLTARIDREERQLARERDAGEDRRPGPRGNDDRSTMFAAALSGEAVAVQRYRDTYTLGTDATAGYLTAPVEFREELIEGLNNAVFMRRISRILPPLTAGQSLGYPARATEAADAEWEGEVDAAAEETTLTYGRREFKPNRMAKLIKLSRTLVSHAPMAERTVREEMQYRIGITQEKAYLTGNGTGKPLGVFTASNDGIPSSRDTSAGNTATAIKIDSLIEAKYMLKQQYWPDSQWIMHRDVAKSISKIKDGEGQYIWAESLVLGQPDRLLGCPVNMSEYAPNTFTTGLYMAIIGNFKQGYWIADTDNISLQVLRELYATTNQVGYMYEYNGDGAPVLGEAFARVKLA